MPDCGVRGPRFESHCGQLNVCHKNHCDMQPCPTTQSSTLRGMIKWESAFGLRNSNKWRWLVWLLAAYRQTRSPDCLAWSECRRPLGAVPYSLYEPGELSQCLCCDDSTINIFMLITIIFIISTLIRNLKVTSLVLCFAASLRSMWTSDQAHRFNN